MTSQLFLDWAVQTGLSVSLLILFVMVIRKPVARRLGAGAAYALWALPLLRLVTPAIPVLPAKTASPVTPEPPFAGFGDAVFVPDLAPAVSQSASYDMSTIVVAAWISGAVLWLLWLSLRQMKFNRHMAATTVQVSDETKTAIEKMAGRLGLSRAPKARQSMDNSGPLVYGLWSPIIIVPANFETDYNQNQQTHALAHEMSHLRHGDLWMSAAALVFRAVNWPNPLVHLAASQFRADQEAACDARVIALFGDDRSTKTAYADTLIKAARLSSNPAPSTMVPTMPLGLTISNPLKERLMILKSNPSNSRSMRVALAGTAALALIATAPLTNAQTPTPPATPDTQMSSSSVDKQVMKWVTNENGVETKKHIEIITEDGVTTAWEIDEIGNRIQVPVESLNMPIGLVGKHDGKMRVMMKKMGDGSELSEAELEAIIEEAMEGVDIEELAGGSGKRRMIIKRMGPDGELMTEDVFGGDVDIDVEAFVGEDGEHRKVIVMENHSSLDLMSDGENSFVFHSGDMTKSQPGIMVDAATGMLDSIDTSDMDRDARRKIEKAQKALKEAQEALAEE